LNTQTKHILASFILVLGWLLIIMAFPSYALFWRVDNEPGAAKIPELLWTAICFLSSGGLLFLSANIYLIIQRSKAIFVAWGLCLVAGIVACGLSPILLIFMV
jgi:hypothetical protein